jgi:DNA-directed RNA polymerase specialized sigma24 family protein
MLIIDDPKARQSVRTIVSRFTSDPALREDLAQEALIHLWLLQERRPKQTRSWYLQSCKYHIRNCIALGRSVDSLKRRAGRVPLPGNDCDPACTLERTESDGPVVGLVSARDIVALLSKRLSPLELQILTGLTEGLGAREIAARLGISHPTVIKHRRKIAALAIRLGIVPLPNSAGRPQRRPSRTRRAGLRLLRNGQTTRPASPAPDAVRVG